MEEIRLSPSKLGDYNRCIRCFHDAYSESKCPKPRGIFPSLPGGMDLIMKNYVDNYRGKLPDMLQGSLPGVLIPNLGLMSQWRHWRTGPTYVDEKNNIVLIGALDDCLLDGEIYIPLDWKTKGSKPKNSGAQYYQTQLDCYNLMLEENGYPTRGEGWLVYIYPEKAGRVVQEVEGVTQALPEVINIRFAMDPYKLICDKERARELIRKAAECLRGPRPESALDCEQCDYLKIYKTIDV